MAHWQVSAAEVVLLRIYFAKPFASTGASGVGGAGVHVRVL